MLLLHGFLSCAPGSWTPACPGPGPMPGTHWALGKVQRNRACRRGGGLNLLDEDGGAGGSSRLLTAPREKRQKTAAEVRAQPPRESLALKNRTPLRAGTGLSPWSWTGAAVHSGAWYTRRRTASWEAHSRGPASSTRWSFRSVSPLPQAARLVTGPSSPPVRGQACVFLGRPHTDRKQSG